jgi:serine/threonine-protein kinase
MAPEQVLGENITEQVDVYAFGVLLFELLTGRKPVEAEAVERIFYSILNEPLKMEPLHEAGIPQSVCDLIARCTAKKPAERPPGFAAVSSELDRLIAELDAPTMALPAMPAPATTVVESPPPAASRPAWLVPAVLVAFVALAAGIYFATKPGTKPGPKQPEAAAVLAKTIAMKGGEMVLVDAGDFLIGQNKEHDTLPAFYIDKTEVSNAAYQRFCIETKHALPKSFPADQPDLPVVNVVISDARAFAEWASKRLPKGREWEKAARGKDGFLYPWGDRPDTTRANVGSGNLLPVSALPGGVSPWGALNLSGNVWELVDEMSPPGPETFKRFTNQFKTLNLAPPTREEPWYMVRGQSFFAGEKLDPAGLWDISTAPGRSAAIDTGFRCVKDAR